MTPKQSSAKKIEELTQALQRERADAVNLRRRHEAEITSLRSRVKADVVAELLPAIDNFERALKHVPKDLEGNDYVKGVQAVVKQFEQTLEQMGVQRIKTVGEHFDPHLHEAVGMEEGEGKHRLYPKSSKPATASATKSSATPWSK